MINVKRFLSFCKITKDRTVCGLYLTSTVSGLVAQQKKDEIEAYTNCERWIEKLLKSDHAKLSEMIRKTESIIDIDAYTNATDKESACSQSLNHVFGFITSCVLRILTNDVECYPCHFAEVKSAEKVLKDASVLLLKSILDLKIKAKG